MILRYLHHWPQDVKGVDPQALHILLSHASLVIHEHWSFREFGRRREHRCSIEDHSITVRQSIRSVSQRVHNGVVAFEEQK